MLPHLHGRISEVLWRMNDGGVARVHARVLNVLRQKRNNKPALVSHGINLNLFCICSQQE